MEFNWQTKDGLQLFAKEWKVADPKAVIALVHGFGEHVVRYDAMAAYYNARGYAMIGSDHRGHGQSEGRRGHTPDYQLFMDEIHELIDVCKERYPGKPLIIYGHSMGGNLTLNYLMQNADPALQLTVVTSPWIRLVQEPPAFLKWIVNLVKKISPTFSQGKKIGTYVSRVQEEVDLYMNDPLNHGTISVSLASAMFKACDRIEQFQGKLPVPALIMHAGDDQITSKVATESFVKQLKSKVTMKIWPGLYHEIHNESIREQVYDYTIEWLDKQLVTA